MMTAREKALVRGTLEAISEYSGAVVRLFYGRLFEIAPQVRPLFKTEIGEQSRRLAEMLGAITASLDHFEEFRPILAELGRRHVEYSVRPEHYELLRTALMWAFGNALGVQFDRETRCAWETLIGIVSAEMLAGAAAPQVL